MKRQSENIIKFGWIWCKKKRKKKQRIKKNSDDLSKMARSTEHDRVDNQWCKWNKKIICVNNPQTQHMLCICNSHIYSYTVQFKDDHDNALKYKTTCNIDQNKPKLIPNKMLKCLTRPVFLCPAGVNKPKWKYSNTCELHFIIVCVCLFVCMKMSFAKLSFFC